MSAYPDPYNPWRIRDAIDARWPIASLTEERLFVVPVTPGGENRRGGERTPTRCRVPVLVADAGFHRGFDMNLLLQYQTKGLILVHNHLSGEATPAPEDDKATTCIRAWLNDRGVRLYDHIIVSGVGLHSYAQAGGSGMSGMRYPLLAKPKQADKAGGS